MTVILPGAVTASVSGETVNTGVTAAAGVTYFGEAAAAYVQGRRDERQRCIALAVQHTARYLITGPGPDGLNMSWTAPFANLLGEDAAR